MADFALFGLCVGLGGLTVKTYWVYLAALIAAAILQPAIRRVLLQPRAVIALAVTALIAGAAFHLACRDAGGDSGDVSIDRRG